MELWSQTSGSILAHKLPSTYLPPPPLISSIYHLPYIIRFLVSTSANLPLSARLFIFPYLTLHFTHLAPPFPLPQPAQPFPPRLVPLLSVSPCPRPTPPLTSLYQLSAFSSINSPFSPIGVAWPTEFDSSLIFALDQISKPHRGLCWSTSFEMLVLVVGDGAGEVGWKE